MKALNIMNESEMLKKTRDKVWSLPREIGWLVEQLSCCREQTKKPPKNLFSSTTHQTVLLCNQLINNLKSANSSKTIIPCGGDRIVEQFKLNCVESVVVENHFLYQIFLMSCIGPTGATNLPPTFPPVYKQANSEGWFSHQ